MCCFQFCFLALALYGFLPGYSGAVEENVDLSANITLDGSICPSGVNFTCIGDHLSVLNWYFDDLLVSYNLKNGNNINLCDSIEDYPDMEEFCDNGGSLFIDSSREDNDEADIYNVTSYLVTTGTYLNQFLDVECGGIEVSADLTLSKFVLSCYPESITLTYNNSNVDTGICEGIVEFVCNGTNVRFIQWTYDDQPLTENINIDNLEEYLNSTLPNIYCEVQSWNTDETFAYNFNFESVCIGDLRDIKLDTVNIGCNSSANYSQVDILCEIPTGTPSYSSPTPTVLPPPIPWFAFLNFLPFFCNISEISSVSDDIFCVAASASLAYGVLLVPSIIIFFICVCFCPCVPDKFSYHNYSVDEDEELNCLASMISTNKISTSGASYKSRSCRCCCCCCCCRHRISLWTILKHIHCKNRHYNRIYDANFSDEYINEKEYDEYEEELRKERNLERVKSEAVGKAVASDSSGKVFPDYKFKKLDDLGSRLQKYWYFRENKKGSGPDMMQMTVKLSNLCRVHLGEKEVSELIGVFKCLQNPLLLSVNDLEVENDSISLLVDFAKNGSVRDIMFGANPCEDWAKKYQEGRYSKTFPDDEIASCGRYVLEAILVLYKQGFSTIGQIHSGNVFKIGDRYVLGGYENTVLGYRTALYEHFAREDLLMHMDEIMFGLLLYEMATGRTSNPILLDQLNLQIIRNVDIKDILSILSSDDFKKIDSKENRIKKILGHTFFQSQSRSDKALDPFEFTPEGMRLVQCTTATDNHLKFSMKDSLLSITDVLDQVKKKMKLDFDPCHSIGWRKGKTWAKAENRILSAIMVPYTCPIFVKSDMDSIRKVLKVEGINLLKVYDVQHMKVHDSHVVVVIKEFVEEGSLKDWIHNKCNPLQPWHDKYSTKRLHTLPDKEVANIGAQVLHSVRQLRYIHGNLDDPLPLQFIHSGNLFWDGKQCRICGVENMLLGCRPQDYVKYKHHLNHIDEFMFGNLIFEMVTGRELAGALPTDSDYRSVSSSSCRKLLTKIFDEKTKLEEILSLDFFKQQPAFDMESPTFKSDVKLCLARVKKGKYRDQDNNLGRTKQLVSKPFLMVSDAVS